MLKRLIAIVFIFGCTAVAWSILGSTVVLRTEVQDRKMKGAVSRLWGTVQTQRAPTVHYRTQHEVQNKRIEGGKTIAEIVAGQKPSIDVTPFSATRFNGA